MDFVIDGILILTCVSAGFYCYVLSRRLKKFSNTETGIGEQILSLNSTLDDVRGSMKGLKQEAEQAAEALSKKIAQSQKVKAELQRRIEEIERTSESLQAAGEDKSIKAASSPEISAREADVGFGALDVPEVAAESGVGELASEPEAEKTSAPPASLMDDVEAAISAEPEDDDGIQSLGFIPPSASSSDEDDSAPSDNSKKAENSRRSDETGEDAFLSVERMLL